VRRHSLAGDHEPAFFLASSSGKSPDALAVSALPILITFPTVATGIGHANIERFLASRTTPSIVTYARGFTLTLYAMTMLAAIHLVAGIHGTALTDVAVFVVAWGVVPAVPRLQLLNAILGHPVDEEKASIVRHATKPMVVHRSAIQPSERSPGLSCADPVSIMPFGEGLVDFAEDPRDFGSGRIGFEMLLDEAVDGLRLIVD